MTAIAAPIGFMTRADPIARIAPTTIGDAVARDSMARPRLNTAPPNLATRTIVRDARTAPTTIPKFSQPPIISAVPSVTDQTTDPIAPMPDAISPMTGSALSALSANPLAHRSTSARLPTRASPMRRMERVTTGISAEPTVFFRPDMTS